VVLGIKVEADVEIAELVQMELQEFVVDQIDVGVIIIARMRDKMVMQMLNKKP
jgi:hypothetical protein